MHPIMICDLKDPDDSQGRTYREINAEKIHTFPIGVLVEIYSGVRAFVVKHTRDCDQMPLYSLGFDPDDQYTWSHGYDEEGMRQITRQ